MSNLEELIERLCPDGVEYKELKNIIKSLNTGLNPRKFFKLNTEDAKNYYVTIREIRGNKIVFSDSTDRINDDALKLCNNRSNLEVGDILFSGTGTIGMTALIDEEPINWNIKEGVYAIKPCSDIIDSKFLMYMLQSNEIKKECLKRIFGGTVKSISMKDLMSIKLPVPPLEVQREIVRILDNFTLLTAELVAELAARQKQYEYYRDLLLTFKPNESTILNERTNELELSSAIRWMKLGELCDYVDYRGKTPKKVDQGIFLVTAKNVRMGFIDYEKSKEYISKDDYLEVMRRGLPKIGDLLITTEAPCGNVALVDREDIALAQRIIKYRPKRENVNRNFLKHYLLSKEFQDVLQKNATGGTVKGIKGSKLHELNVPVPPLEVQQRIVDILDRFDALCNDISNGLPAEIEARQKQYEYYRDKLLTFKELKKEA